MDPMDPKDGALSAVNYARNSPVVGTEFNSGVSGNTTVTGFPATNVTDPNREKKWKVAGFTNTGDTDVDKPWARVIIDTERDINPGMVAIIGSNISQGTFRLYGADDAAMTENLIAYDLEAHAAPNSGVIACYPNSRKVRVPGAYEMDHYSGVSQSPISSSFDILDNNVRQYDELCRLNPGYHTYTGSDFSADYIEYIPTIGGMMNYRSSVAAGAAQSEWYSWMWWPSAPGSQNHWNSTKEKSWPGSGRSELGHTNRSIGMTMPAQSLQYDYYDWADRASRESAVVESTELQHGYAVANRATHETICPGAANNNGWKSSTSKIVFEQTFRLVDTNDSGRWSLIGWSTSTGADTGLEYHKHVSDPDLSYFNLRIWPTDVDASSLQFVVPESRILDGKFHTFTLAYRGVAAASTYALLFDGEDLSGGTQSTSHDDTSDPYLPYTIGFWSSPSSASTSTGDEVHTAGTVTGTSGAGFADSDATVLAAAQDLDKQARLRYEIGGMGPEDLKRSFWMVEFDGVNNYGFDGDELEIGTIWIGDRHDFSPVSSSNIGEQSRNLLGASYGGSTFSTVRNSCRTASIEVNALTKAEALDLNDAVGSANIVIVDALAGGDSDADKDAGAIYGVIDEQPSQAVNYNNTGVRWQVKESL